MKTIGLIGGMSWESSAEYYRIINQQVQKRLGGVHSAKCVMYSVDFAEIETLQHEDRWEEAADILRRAGESLASAGADFFVLCTNTMHQLLPAIEEDMDIPYLHIADATAEKIRERSLRTIGLLGTKFTMEGDFYRGRLESKFRLDVVIPDAEDREIVHNVIYEELVQGKIDADSKSKYLAIVDKLIDAGTEGIILGCTEIGLLIKDGDRAVPFFDTTEIHAEAAVEYALTD